MVTRIALDILTDDDAFAIDEAEFQADLAALWAKAEVFFRALDQRCRLSNPAEPPPMEPKPRVSRSRKR